MADDMSQSGARAPESEGFVKAADLLRFWLHRLIQDAEVLGSDMDAPVRLHTDLTAVELNSIRQFLDRYNAERGEVTEIVELVAERDRYRKALERIADVARAEGTDIYAWANESHEEARVALGLDP